MRDGGWVYILASKGKRLYTGITSELRVRVKQHKDKVDPDSFTARYNVDQLVYFVGFESMNEAIARETAIKKMTRLKKVHLIVAVNPDWRDLSLDWARRVEFTEAGMGERVRF